MYTVHDVLSRGYNIEPLTCLKCGEEGETTFDMTMGDAFCAICGSWQLAEEKRLVGQQHTLNERDIEGIINRAMSEAKYLNDLPGRCGSVKVLPFGVFIVDRFGVIDGPYSEADAAEVLDELNIDMA